MTENKLISLKNLSLEDPHKRTSYLSPELVLLNLPYRDPKVANWDKVSKANNSKLIIHSGQFKDEETSSWLPYGIPYGVYARIMLYYVCKEIKVKKNHYVSFGNNFDEMFQNLGLAKQGQRIGGRNIALLKNQYLRLFSAQIHLDYQIEDKFTIENLNMAQKIEFWGKNSDNIDYGVEVSMNFFDYVIEKSNIPFDFNFIPLLKHSPLLMDLYILFNHKANTVHTYKNELFISYLDLHSHMGTTTTMKEFKRMLKDNLKQLIVIHPSLALEEGNHKGKDGIWIKKGSKSNVIFNDKQESLIFN